MSLYNILTSESLADPYPIYHELRSTEPVFLDEYLGCWVVTRYSDVKLALSNPYLSSERVKADRLRGKEWEEFRALFHVVSKQILLSDPPDHARIRSLMHKAFTPHVVNTMRSHVQHIVNRLLDQACKVGYIDIIRDFAYPLPATVIAEMLGVPKKDHDQFRQWTNDLANFLGNPPTISQSKQARESVQALISYFRNLVIQRKNKPKDDLLNALIVAEEQGNVLTEEELFSNCMGLFTAGHETTTNLIGNGLLALLHNPDQLQKLRSEPTFINTAIEELLRYDSPIQYTARLAKRDVEIGGKRIGQGQGIMLIIGAANRDPEQFADPDRLDITRWEVRHLSFGHNIHFCIGAALARMEGQIAIKALLEKLPNLRLRDSNLEWQENLAFRGLKALNVSFDS